MEAKVKAETRTVFFFGEGYADGGAGDHDLLGGKGAHLQEMTRQGLPVPPGFTISTEVCRRYLADGALPPGVDAAIEAALARVEAILDLRLGDPDAPLLVSVRSGARASMPGMMDTILNLGLNDQTVEGLARRSQNPRFAWDSYRRFVQMYANVVLGLDPDILEGELSAYKASSGKPSDLDLTADDWKEVTSRFRSRVTEELGREVPQDPREQLAEATLAVFRSWNTPRAKTYRRLHRIPDDWGTAVSVVAMVFGNLGEGSCTGVVFSRNPSTGARGAFGEYLVNAQGEDVVAGTRQPAPINEASRSPGAEGQTLEARLPETYRALTAVLETLERHYRDMQDVEFTVEDGRLWLLQTRTGKRAGRAAVRIALELLDQGVIDEREALCRIDADLHMRELMHPQIAPDTDRGAPLTSGLAASPGAAVGALCFDADEAVRRAEAGEAVVLCRQETSADDIHGMHAAAGVLTRTGGVTSHAAVVCRGMGKPCVCGAGAIAIDAEGPALVVGDTRLGPDRVVTIDGSTGAVYPRALPLEAPGLSEDLDRLLQLADRHRRLGVYANADTPEDAARARGFGAKGIGLCRTEHMFFQPATRLLSMRALVLAETDEQRSAALERLRPAQHADFYGILREMDGLPVIVRLLDPPLHEFLPRDDQEVEALAQELQMAPDEIRKRAADLDEHNPMLGHRGCRLGITFPAIYRMQTEALIDAALELKREGLDPQVEIMVPLVAFAEELRRIRALIEEAADERIRAAGVELPYLVGTMIELPRAALRAGVIARHADFFSFGTNDLTQATLGVSRDDAGSFLSTYVDGSVLPRDPFASLDPDGVGQLVKLGVERGREARPGMEIGVCGEHGGDPESIAHFDGYGLDYVSCSPFRVPVARLAAAQSAIRLRGPSTRFARSG